MLSGKCYAFCPEAKMRLFFSAEKNPYLKDSKALVHNYHFVLAMDIW